MINFYRLHFTTCLLSVNFVLLFYSTGEVFKVLKAVSTRQCDFAKLHCCFKAVFSSYVYAAEGYRAVFYFSMVNSVLSQQGQLSLWQSFSLSEQQVIHRPLD